jgi:hypothetical protein
MIELTIRINTVSFFLPNLSDIGYQDRGKGVTSELQVTYRLHTTSSNSACGKGYRLQFDLRRLRI